MSSTQAIRFKEVGTCIKNIARKYILFLNNNKKTSAHKFRCITQPEDFYE